ncbi:AfsR/SARP family transcriptional regulator [Streptoalloteichus hindustanus]|uniref:AfsR/SARP family transcriptional regulator n=1 Tax=Streptoalloteichus hindustanus TaxID=2017 RepID=UPI00190EA9C0|nr:AfsR/SARP family transcriptional regulator [Streptoalloteichus hindustanus]
MTSAPSARKLRTVLAMLMVHEGRPVQAAALMGELWGEGVPTSGATTLQTYILKLRKLLAQATGLSPAEVARRMLVTRAGGYLLDLGAAELDIRSYRELVAAGGEALALADDGSGVRRLTQALALWRGPAFVDVPVGRVLESRRCAYEESRLVVTEYLIDAKLRLGMSRELVSDLASLTVEHPLHEGLHARYMHVLHVCGRRASALEVFHRLRTRLVTELGLEPGEAVQRVHQAVLTANVELDVSARGDRPLGEILRTPA